MNPITALPSPEQPPVQPLTYKQALIQLLDAYTEENSILIPLESAQRIKVERLKLQCKRVKAKVLLDLYKNEEKPRNEKIAESMLCQQEMVLDAEDKLQQAQEMLLWYGAALEDRRTIRHTLHTKIEHIDAYNVVFNVKDFGAKADDITDDAATIQKAINQDNSLTNMSLLPEELRIAYYTKIKSIRQQRREHENALQEIEQELYPKNPLDTL